MAEGKEAILTVQNVQKIFNPKKKMKSAPLTTCPSRFIKVKPLVLSVNQGVVNRRQAA